MNTMITLLLLLQHAIPKWSIDDLTRDDGLAFRDRTYDYYKARRYWEGPLS